MLPEGRERLPEALYVQRQTLRHCLRELKRNFSINKSTTITQRTVDREQSYNSRGRILCPKDRSLGCYKVRDAHQFLWLYSMEAGFTYMGKHFELVSTHQLGCQMSQILRDMS